MRGLRISPHSDDFLKVDDARVMLEGIIANERLSIKISHNNRFSLFHLGMVFALMSYQDAIRDSGNELIPKTIIPIDNSTTPGKSHYNVLDDMSRGRIDKLPRYFMNPTTVFMISPVRKAEDKDLLRKKKEELLEKYQGVHLPLDDTLQTGDDRGTRICRDNLTAQASSRQTEIWFNEESYGSVFDLGTGFMLQHYIDRAVKSMNLRSFHIMNPQAMDISRPYDKFVADLVNS